MSTMPVITSTAPMYLFRVQHKKSNSSYVDGVGVVSTHHRSKDIPSDVPKLLDRLEEDIRNVSGVSLRTSPQDLYNHEDMKSEAPTSFVSTSKSLEFAMYWAQLQHQNYYHKQKEIRILVIDVAKIRQQGLKYWEVLTRLNSRFAKSFEEWVVEVYIPESAIVRVISWETILCSRPDWYPPLSYFEGRVRFSLNEWRMAMRQRFKRMSEIYGESKTGHQAIVFIQQLATHEEKVMVVFSGYAYNQLFQMGKVMPSTSKALVLALVRQIKILVDMGAPPIR